MALFRTVYLLNIAIGDLSHTQIWTLWTLSFALNVMQQQTPKLGKSPPVWKTAQISRAWNSTLNFSQCHLQEESVSCYDRAFRYLLTKYADTLNSSAQPKTVITKHKSTYLGPLIPTLTYQSSTTFSKTLRKTPRSSFSTRIDAA